MPKKNQISTKTKNTYAILIYFIGGFTWLNRLDISITNNSIGVALLIAAVYGVVCVGKNQKFLF